MQKNIYLDNNGGNFIATLAEDGKLLEYYMEKNSNPNLKNAELSAISKSERVMSTKLTAYRTKHFKQKEI